MARAVEHYIVIGKWWMDLFLAMPDHWHALASFQDAGGMEKVLRDWKRFVARSTGVAWQDGFFEHRLRSQKSADEKWHYLRLNPVRKGLVTNPEDWPYVWMPDESEISFTADTSSPGSGALGITRPT
jgi:putative transposase